MGGLANFAGALGGAIAQTTNRWIDEEMQMNKARALAELQRATAKGIREDDAEFNDRRAPIVRQQKADDAKAAAATADDIELSRLGNTTLMGARQRAKDAEYDAETDRGIRRLAAETPAKNKAAMDAAKQQAADAEFMAAQKAIKLNDPEVAARISASRAAAAASGAHASLYNTQAESARMDIGTKKRLDQLYGQAEELLTNENIGDAERASKMAKVQQQITLLKSKSGQVSQRDPELDTQTVTEEKMNPDGSTTKTTRKEVRRPGAGGDGKAPYPDGTELRGKDGKVYVVQGGQPVLKEATKAPTAKPAGMLQMAEPERPPELSSMDKGIYADLQPLVERYQQARAQLQGAARSGDGQSIQRYTQAMNQLSTQLRQQAEERLGNGAQRFLSSVL